MIVNVDKHGPFVLDEDFIESYRHRPVPWGFGDLSWVVYQRTYSRNGETWTDTCRRVVEGMFTVLRTHCIEQNRRWYDPQSRSLAYEAFHRLWQFQWTPPGRGLWIMGTRFMYERGGAALNNCGFVSTRNIASDYAGPFVWMLLMSMLGVGVGFDMRGRGMVRIHKPVISEEMYTIEDSREGWADALRTFLCAYTEPGQFLPREWNFSRIRPRGTKLESFGGFASGPGPLQDMLETLRQLYDQAVGSLVDSRLIVDTMNIIGRCVVAGGIRRSAQIAFGDAADAQFLDLKQDPKVCDEYRWVANHSLFVKQGMDYGDALTRTCRNGEPGFFWLDNARAYGRRIDPPDDRDEPALGSNPCVEQTLWDRELCCLVETFPAHHDTLRDFQQTLHIAYLYAKAVTLVPTEDPATNAVMLRNRRIGCSMTGVVQAIDRLGRRRFLQWCDESYSYLQRLDQRESDWLGIPQSIKLTSVKPSGTVSLLAGATPGVHWSHAPYYLRRVRVREDHPLAAICQKANYPIEPDGHDDKTLVVSFPVHVEGMDRSKAEVSPREKIELAVQMQRYWSDNQVSCTVDFDPGCDAAELPRLLREYEDQLKAIALLPRKQHGYQQPPYEEITPETYHSLQKKIRPLRGELKHEHELESCFCDGDLCQMQNA